MKKIFMFLLIYSVFSCKEIDTVYYKTAAQNNCKIDNKFKDKYYRNIEIIENYHSSPNDSLLDNLVEAYDYIYSITKIKGQETIGYMGIYYQGNKKKKLQEDINKWKKWYEENKCTITLKMADSIYVDYVNNSGE